MDISEQAIIGAITRSPDVLVDIINRLSRKDFTDRQAGASYATLCDMWRNGLAIDLITLVNATMGIVSPAWIAESTNIGLVSMAGHYTEIVVERAKKKRIQEELARLAKDDVFESADILQTMTEIHDKETGHSCKDVEITNVIDRFDLEVARNKEYGMGVDTGFDFLNSKSITYCPSHVWVVGGFTSVGKTAMLTEMVSRVDTETNKVAIISTEMTEAQMVARYLANKTGFSSSVILSGRIYDGNKPKLNTQKDLLRKQNLHIFDHIYEISEIESALIKLKMQGGVDVVFLDYLQNCQVSGAKSEYAEMSTLAKRIQKIAKKVRATIVCFSQLSNSAAKDDNDLLQYKGAGDFAAIADLGIVLRRNKENKSQILLEAKKNRHGQTAKQVLQYEDGWTRIIEVDHVQNE